jgi:sugar phosphate isomerase/epimerase
MQPAISQVCSLNSAFEQDIEDYAAGQCTVVELWLTKLEGYVDANGLEQTRRLLESHGAQAPVASFHGGLLTSQGAAREAAWELFARRLALCQELHIETLVIACDAFGPLTEQDIERLQVSLRQAAAFAGERGIRLALEFNAKAALGNNLQTAVALVADAGSPHLGICLDAFHYYVGPSKPEDLQLLTIENLFHVQLCDLADAPRELAADGNRILPGDGDIPLTPIVDRLREIQYDRCVSVELMNPQIWQIPARQFGEIAMTALRQVLGQASMQ